MKPKQKLILFDFDGVIANTFKMAFLLNQKLSKPPKDKVEYRDMFMGNIYESVKKVVDKTKRDEHHRMWFELYMADVLDQPLHKGMKNAIVQLAKKYTLVVVSSTTNNPIAAYLEHHKLHHYFDTVYGADVHFSKIKKIEMVFKKYGVKAKDCVFVTDTVGDLREAKEKGVKSIVVTWGFHEKERFKKYPPLAFVNNAKELVQAIDKYFNSKK